MIFSLQQVIAELTIFNSEFEIYESKYMLANKTKRRLKKVKKIAGYTSTAATIGILVTTLIQRIRKKKNQ
ncbi:MAG TPA: hypothetical protein VLB50_01800 [Ignavibacteriaceae bacterium]|nr:hypothetical protein [Ignavibacteriaceae bacterium]